MLGFFFIHQVISQRMKITTSKVCFCQIIAITGNQKDVTSVDKNTN